MTLCRPNRFRVAHRAAHLAAIAATVTVCASVAVTGASAQSDPPPDDETAERHLIDSRGINTGRTEAGVGVTGIAGLIDVNGVGAAGPGGGTVPTCRWAVVYTPQADTEANVAVLQQAAELRGLESDAGVDQGWMAASLDTLAHDLALQGAAVEDELRFVTPYAPEGVDAAVCNTDPGVWVTVAEVEDLALMAFSEVQRSWPAQEVGLGWPEPTEDTWTALATGMPWLPLSATASSGGLMVTVTATPVDAVWDMGEVNTRVGAPGSVTCAGPGDLPVLQSEASCRVWFAGPSTGLVDRSGREDAITLGVTVRWQVGYESNFAGFADPDWLTWPTTASLDGVVVNTSQAVGTVGEGSGA